VTVTGAGVSRRTKYPLTPAQVNLWLADRLNPRMSAYNLVDAYELTGRVDPDALGRALRHVGDRNPVLRLTIQESIEGSPEGWICWEKPLELHHVSLDLSLRDPAAEVARMAAEHARERVDFANGPLFAMRLLQFDPSLCYLVVHQHHLLADDWSARLFWRDLSESYNALLAGGPVPAANDAGYAGVVTKHLQEVALATGRSRPYWERSLSAYTGRLSLPLDPAGEDDHTSDRVRRVVIGADLVNALDQGGAGADITFFAALLSALAAALAPYRSCECVVIGCPAVNRLSLEEMETPGLFANTLPICIAVGGEPSMRELAGRTQRALWGALEHQRCSVAEIAKVAPRSVRAGGPLIQAGLVLEDVAGPAFDGAGARRIEVEPNAAAFDLAVITALLPGGGMEARFLSPARRMAREALDAVAATWAHALSKLAFEFGRTVPDDAVPSRQR
jgi:condensation domain-containing protein